MNIGQGTVLCLANYLREQTSVPYTTSFDYLQFLLLQKNDTIFYRNFQLNQRKMIYKKSCRKLATLYKFLTTHRYRGPLPLVVPKTVRLLFTSRNFDLCANSHFLQRPQDAVVFLSCKPYVYRRDWLRNY